MMYNLPLETNDEEYPSRSFFHVCVMSFILFFFKEFRLHDHTSGASKLLNYLAIFPEILVDFFKASSHEGNA
jgi:hypothetical protein